MHDGEMLWGDAMDDGAIRWTMRRSSRLEKIRAFCGKNTKFGSTVHYTRTIKLSYSAMQAIFRPGGCGGHFPKWPLYQKLKGTERSISTQYVSFVGHRFQKSIAECIMPL